MDKLTIVTKSSYWKEVMPKDSYVLDGDTMWASPFNEDFTLVQGFNTMDVITIPFIAYGSNNDILGGSFYGSNHRVKILVVDEDGVEIKSYAEGKSSGELRLIMPVSLTAGSKYYLEVTMQRNTEPSNAVLNHFVLFGVISGGGWREVLPQS